MGATVVIDAHVDLDDAVRRIRLVPSGMDVCAEIQLVIHCGNRCVVITNTLAEAIEFLMLTVKDYQTVESPQAVDAVAKGCEVL